ncbi:hypothetical protein K1T71_000745 [Dendrolimus kikuchii]|uniref:Uncharacterized protein n=1 Tax=Dendrolimus kikuchii TaxID=765133 RepID=A0ACC1DK91_9NEOP|nr:hypothetical protein K1T71_000745 [Dendrolimus kikuchii]
MRMKLSIFTLLAFAGCVFARTATRTQTVSPHITSLTDKDARTKASVHPAFANAGRQAGVEIWRIENFEPVPVAQKDYGTFYKGDSYIILKTTVDKRNNFSWDIHYWIGSESSQDESGAAAILTVGLDDKFGGAAVQHREVLGQESSQFTGYFSSPITYQNGGVGTGFNHVVTNAGAAKRMFQVKGKRNVRVRQKQVRCVRISLNGALLFVPTPQRNWREVMYVSKYKSVFKISYQSVDDNCFKIQLQDLPRTYIHTHIHDVYVLDTVSGSIYVWVGKQATEREKTEAMTKAQQIFSSKNYPSWVQNCINPNV